MEALAKRIERGTLSACKDERHRWVVSEETYQTILAEKAEPRALHDEQLQRLLTQRRSKRAEIHQLERLLAQARESESFLERLIATRFDLLHPQNQSEPTGPGTAGAVQD